MAGVFIWQGNYQLVLEFDELMNKGFFLIELVVGVAVLSILSSIVLPQLVNTDKLLLMAAAQQITADLRYLQEVDSNVSVGSNDFPEINTNLGLELVFFHKENNGYYLVKGSNVVKTIELPKNVAVNSSYTKVAFDTNGYTKPQHINLTVNRQLLAVIIDNAGRIRIQ